MKNIILYECEKCSIFVYRLLAIEMYVNTLESKEFVNTKENQQMNKEMFVPQEESMRFRLDKVVEAVSEGILGEMLKQDKKRRDSRSRLHHLQVNTETTKAYEYYWRLLKEY